MNVQRAAMKDIDQVVGLFDAYRQFYGQASDVEGARRFLTERFQKCDSVILLAEDSGNCLGFYESLGWKRDADFTHDKYLF